MARRSSAPAMAGPMAVVTAVVVDRDDRVIMAVVEVFRRGRLVIVIVTVNDAHEAAGLCRIADPAVSR